ncbi:MAG: T9SS type A sorting domain-containing protein, partial [Bacteroidota bacterium]
NADHLNLYIRYADTLSWHLIKSYRDTISGWRSDTVYLPHPTSNYRLAFEGVGHNGGGVAVDDINISRDTNAFTPEFQVVGDERLCEEEYVSFMIDTGKKFNSYSWDFGYGASPRYVSGYGPHTVQYTEPGEKTVQLTIDGTYKNIKKGAVTVDTLPPKPTIEVEGDTLSTQSEGDIQWYEEEMGIIEGATDSIYIATEEGIYRVGVTNQYGCSVFSDTIHYTGTNAIPMPEPGEEQLKIYPVPSEETFYIQYASEKYQRALLTVVNSSGLVVKEAEIELHSGINRRPVDIANLPPGIYIVRLRLSDGIVLHSRLIKE